MKKQFKLSWIILARYEINTIPINISDTTLKRSNKAENAHWIHILLLIYRFDQAVNLNRLVSLCEFCFKVACPNKNDTVMTVA